MNPLQLCLRICGGIASRARNIWFRALGVRLRGYVWLRRVSIPRQWSDVTLEAGVALDDGVVLLCSGPAKPDKLVIRAKTYVNRYTMFDAHQRIEVGRHCMIGPHCYITDANHGTAPGALVQKQGMKAEPVIIEDDVWVGAGAIVLAGVRVGRGAILGAGAVVTSDIPANAIAVGVPARVVRQRD